MCDEYFVFHRHIHKLKDLKIYFLEFKKKVNQVRLPQKKKNNFINFHVVCIRLNCFENSFDAIFRNAVTSNICSSEWISCSYVGFKSYIYCINIWSFCRWCEFSNYTRWYSWLRILMQSSYDPHNEFFRSKLQIISWYSSFFKRYSYRLKY